MGFKRKISNFFVPTAQNQWRAWILQPRFLTPFVIVILLGQLFFNLFPLIKPGVLGYSSDITPDKIVLLTNKERQKAGLVQLNVNHLLNEAARRKAADMFAFNYWAHVSPSGRTPWLFFKEVGYRYTVAGENLAKDFADSESVLQAWMASPSHRDNILDKRFRDIGVAVVRGDLGGIRTTLIVQLFGAPIGIAAAGKEKPALTSPLLSKQLPAGPLGGASKINPLPAVKLAIIFIAGALLGALIVDSWVVRRYHIYRMGGRNTAHAGLLIAILLLVILTRPGIIF